MKNITLKTFAISSCLLLISCTNMTDSSSSIPTHDERMVSNEWAIWLFDAQSGLAPAGLIIPVSHSSSRTSDALMFCSESEMKASVGRLLSRGCKIVNQSKNDLGISCLSPLNVEIDRRLADVDEHLNETKTASKGWVVYSFKADGSLRPALAVPETNRSMPLDVMISRAVFIMNDADLTRILQLPDHRGYRIATQKDIDRVKAIGVGDIFVVR